MQNHSSLRNGGKYIYTRKNSGQRYPVIIHKLHKTPTGALVGINQTHANTGIMESIRPPSKYRNLYSLRGGKRKYVRSSQKRNTRKFRS